MMQRQDRTPAQRWAEDALAQHAHQLELRGAPNDLRWPRVCANCGQAAVEQIQVKKAFRPRPRRHSRGSSRTRPYRIAAAPVPMCSQCAAEHRAVVRPPSAATKLATIIVNPLIIPAVGSAWVASLVSGGLRDTPEDRTAALMGWGLFALMAATCVWSVFLMWQTTRASRLDPLTAIARACDFSEDVSYAWEKERRIYALQNREFAEAFGKLNADRVWTAADQSRSKRTSMMVAVITLLVFGGVAALLSLTGR